ncbi:MAG: rhodanese-like domain-containing protein [Nitrospinota bacterium]|nr:rhodanese-like domain-containing protein [Nitrospinota bacterium]
MKNKKLVIGVITIMFAMSAVYDLFASNDTFKSVSPQEAVQAIKSGNGSLVLDVRTPQEFHGPLGHIKGAKLIPVQDLASRVSELESYREKTIYVVCRSGMRSRSAARFLTENGFTSVINVESGMTGVNHVQGAPIEK